MKKFILILVLLAFTSAKIVLKLSQYSPASTPQKFSKHGKRVLLEQKKPKTFAITKSFPKSDTRYIKLGLNGGKTYYNFEVSTQQAQSFIPAVGCNSNCWPQNTPNNEANLYKCDGLCTFKNTDTVSNVEFNKFHKLGPLKVNTGFKAKDEINVNKKFIAKQVSLILGTGFANRNANSADGTIGFGYSKDQTNLIAKLKANGVIKSAVFAFSVSDTATFVTIGASEKYFAAEEATVYDQIQTDERWQLKIASIKHNKEVISQSLHTANQVALIDATVEQLLIPEAQFNNLKALIVQKLGSDKCSTDTNGVFGCKCENLEKLPQLEVAFVGVESKYHILSPTNYADYVEGKCILSVGYTTGTEWVLGRRFLKNFYTVFDNDQAKIKIAKAKGINPQSHIMDDTTRGLVIGLGIAVSLISIVALLVLLAPVQVVKFPTQQIRSPVKLVELKQSQPVIVQKPVVVNQQVPVIYNQPTIANSQFRSNVVQQPFQQVQQSVQYVQRY